MESLSDPMKYRETEDTAADEKVDKNDGVVKVESSSNKFEWCRETYHIANKDVLQCYSWLRVMYEKKEGYTCKNDLLGSDHRLSPELFF